MKRILMSLIMLMLSLPCFGARYTNSTSGYFTNGAIWVGGTAPSVSNDSWVIVPSTTVTFNKNNPGIAWGASILNGTLDITNAADLRFVGVLSGAGTFTVGRVDAPIGTNTVGWTSTGQTVRIWKKRYSGQHALTSSGSIKIYGGMRYPSWAFLAVAAPIGTNELWLKTPLDVRSNDVIAVTRPLKWDSDDRRFNFVTAYDAASLKITLGRPAAAAFTNQFWYPGWNMYFNTAIASVRRDANVCAVMVLSRDVLINCSPSSDSSSYFRSCSNGVFQGVRVLNTGNTGLTQHSMDNFQFLGCVMTSGAGVDSLSSSSAKGYYSNCISTISALGYSNTIVDSLFAEANQSITGGRGGDIVSNVHFITVGHCLNSGINILLTGCTNYFGLTGLVNQGQNFRVVNSYSFSNTAGLGNMPRETIYYNSGCAESPNGMYVGTVGTRSTFISCWASNTPFMGAGASSALFVDCTNLTPNAVSNFSQYTIGYVSVINDACVAYSGGTQIVLGANGHVETQTNVVAPTTVAQTFLHRPQGGDVSRVTDECKWRENAVVRPYGTARWSVYMRQEDASILQRAAIFKESSDLGWDTGWPQPLAVVTNTAAISNWYSGDISWRNPNAWPVNVVLTMGCTGAVNSTAYSAAIKQDDKQLWRLP
jgi:hypothetical protein